MKITVHHSRRVHHRLSLRQTPLHFSPRQRTFRLVHQVLQINQQLIYLLRQRHRPLRPWTNNCLRSNPAHPRHLLVIQEMQHCICLWVHPQNRLYPPLQKMKTPLPWSRHKCRIAICLKHQCNRHSRDPKIEILSQLIFPCKQKRVNIFLQLLRRLQWATVFIVSIGILHNCVPR